MPIDSPVRCPICSGALGEVGEGIHCMQCEGKFETVAGAIDLRRPASERETAAPDARAALAQLARAPLHRLIRDICRQASDAKAGHRVRHPLEGTECAWKLFVDPGPGLRILDLGCGYGARSVSLARHGSELIAIAHERFPAMVTAMRLADATPPQTRDLHRVLIVAGLARLPLKDNCIDLVVLPIDLACDRTTVWNSPCSTDSLMLEVDRVLKPSGRAVLTAANRWAADRLAAKVNRFVSRWPGGRERKEARRALEAASATADFCGSGPSGLGGYRRALARGGLRNIESWVLVRDASCSLVGLREAAPASRPPVGAGLKARIKQSVAFAPEFVLLAQRGNPLGMPLIERILEAVAAGLVAQQRSASGLRIVRYHVSRKDKLVAQIESGEDAIILRLCLSPAARSAEERAASALRGLASSRAEAKWYPRVVAAGEVDGLFFTAEQKIEGRSLLSAAATSSERDLLQTASNVLLRNNPELAGRPPTPFDGSLYDALITEPLKRLSRVVASGDSVPRLEQWFARELRGRSVAVGLVHGDLSLNNVLLQADGTHALIDWENSSPETLPIFDAIGFLRSVDTRRNRSHQPGPARARMAVGRLSAAEETFLAREYSRGQLPRQAHAALVYLQWLHAITSNLDFAFMQLRENIERYVDAVVRAIPDEILRDR